jgi:hypothetical protein
VVLQKVDPRTRPPAAPGWSKDPIVVTFDDLIRAAWLISHQRARFTSFLIAMKHR